MEGILCLVIHNELLLCIIRTTYIENFNSRLQETHHHHTQTCQLYSFRVRVKQLPHLKLPEILPRFSEGMYICYHWVKIAPVGTKIAPISDLTQLPHLRLAGLTIHTMLHTKEAYIVYVHAIVWMIFQCMWFKCFEPVIQYVIWSE